MICWDQNPVRESLMSMPIRETGLMVDPPQPSAADPVKAAVLRDPVVLVVAVLVGLVHAATAGRYDAQRNELYFLACGWHPDFGYVDQPPLVPLIAAATVIARITDRLAG